MKTHDGKTRRGTAENKMVMDGGEEADFPRTKSSKPARDYQISQITEVPRINTELDLINLQIKEFKKGKIKFLFDTGTAVTIKLRNLRGETLICEDEMTLAGVSRTRNNCFRKNNCYHTIR